MNGAYTCNDCGATVKEGQEYPIPTEDKSDVLCSACHFEGLE